MALIISENTKTGKFIKTRELSSKDVNVSYENSVKFINSCFETLFDYLPQKNKPTEITSDTTEEEIKNIFEFALYGITRKYDKYSNSVNNSATLSYMVNETEGSLATYVYPTIYVTRNFDPFANKMSNIQLTYDNLYFNTDSFEFREYEDEEFSDTLLGKIYKENNKLYAMFNNVFLSSSDAINSGKNLYDYLEKSINRINETSSNISEIKHDEYGLTHIYSLDKTSNNSCELKLNEQSLEIIKKENNVETKHFNLWDYLNSIPSSYASSIANLSRTLTIEFKKDGEADKVITGDLDYFGGIYSYMSVSSGGRTIYNYAINHGDYIEFAIDAGHINGYKEDRTSFILKENRLMFKRYRTDASNTVLINQTYDMLKVTECFRIYNSYSKPTIEIFLNGVISPHNNYGAQTKFEENFPQDVEFSATGHYINNYIIAIKWYVSSGTKYLQIKYLNGQVSSSSPVISGDYCYWYPDISTYSVPFSSLMFGSYTLNDYNS